VFGEDISQTPIRNAVRDAKKYDVDYLVVVLETDWSQVKGGVKEDQGDEVGAFDQLFRTKTSSPSFTEDIPHEWTKQPQIVFWVKKAMGGAAFLPPTARRSTSAVKGKMGGIGHLNKIFGSTGDKVVQEKQFSLRLGHAEGHGHPGRLRAQADQGDGPRRVRAVLQDGGRQAGVPRADARVAR
jgi:hypothetical protein